MRARPVDLVVIGDGRAGGSFAGALSAAGWEVKVRDHATLARGDVGSAPRASVLICVPDPQVASVAEQLHRDDSRVVMHCAGSLGLDVLGTHPRVASVHPLVALSDPLTGAQRLRGAWFGVAGDDLARRIVDALGGRPIDVPDEARVRYHATAVVASNHLVALMGQVERLAGSIDVPVGAFLDLGHGALDDVSRVGAAAALTGPVARGDLDTVDRHVSDLPADERDAYRAGAQLAQRLIDQRSLDQRGLDQRGLDQGADPAS